MQVSLFQHAKFFGRWLLVLFNSVKKRFIPISLPCAKKQVLYDKKARKLFTYRIRSYQDWITLRQVYFNEDYRMSQLTRSDEIFGYYRSLMDSGQSPLVVDCGANIGLSARYFLDEFPGSRIIAIEISAENCRQISKNFEDTDGLRVCHNAVARRAEPYEFFDPELGENAFRATASKDGDLLGLPIDSVIEANKDCTPFIIKIDIEGGESELFSDNVDWLDTFPVVIIELHDWLLPGSASSQSFLAEISKLNRDFIMCGENVFSISNSGLLTSRRNDK